MHQYLGVGVGEHLGYLFTGLWTVLTGVAIAGTELMPAWMGWVGIVLGAGLIVGSAEFLGSPRREMGGLSRAQPSRSSTSRGPSGSWRWGSR